VLTSLQREEETWAQGVRVGYLSGDLTLGHPPGDEGPGVPDTTVLRLGGSFFEATGPEQAPLCP
jgi:hypothetical protein